jgi:nicotinamidase-related amidase
MGEQIQMHRLKMFSPVSLVGIAVIVLGTGAFLIAFASDPRPSNRGGEPAAATQKDDAVLPNPGFTIDPKTTALVVTDPQNDFLSPSGVTWGVVGKSVTKNRTVENLTDLFQTAKEADIPVFISPHYYFPHDHRWHFEGALEKLMHSIHMFDRRGPLDMDGFAASGADWLERFKPFINDGKTVVVSPHKLFGPQSNDLCLQLRKRGVNKVLLAGMSANLCTESHLRELQEQGFEVAVAWDATAAPQFPEMDGMAAALVNFRMLASETITTHEAVRRLRGSAATR